MCPHDNVMEIMKKDANHAHDFDDNDDDDDDDDDDGDDDDIDADDGDVDDDNDDENADEGGLTCLRRSVAHSALQTLSTYSGTL